MKNFKNKIAFLFIVVVALIPFIAGAQDSTATGAGAGTTGLPTWVPLVGSLALGIYELLVRLIPTVKNYSIVGWIIKIIQLIVPNNAAPAANTTQHP